MVGTPSLAWAAPGEVRTVAQVISRQGEPTLVINGEAVPPLIYFFPVPDQKHVERFYRAGVRLYSWGSGNVIGHCHDMGWIGPGQYDHSLFDREIQEILEVAPDCHVFPRLSVSAPAWWLAKNPSESIVFEGEQPNKPRTSMASRLWRREAGETLERFIHHVRAQPYARNVIGYQLVGGHNEWFYVSSGDRGFPDFSPPAVAAFRAWLRATYGGSVDALQDAWKARGVTFENAEVPPAAMRMKTDVGLLRNPATSRQVSDFYQFLSETNAEALIELSRVAKNACQGESLVGAFYGYLINATGGYAGGNSAQHWGHQALRKVLAAPEVDFLCAPYHYSYRGKGGSPTSQGLPASVKLHGKLWITECDNPPFVAGPGVWRMGADDYTPAESLDILKRDFAHNFIRKVGMWWMDLHRHGGWYDHPEIEKVVAQCAALAAESAANDAIRYRGEVAVILDEETSHYLKPGNELLYPLVFLQDKLGLPRLGAPVDYYLHNDLSHRDMPEYKLYIFLNTIYLTAEERRAIRRRVCRDNKVAVWMYAPGLISEAGIDAGNMRDLTGIKLAFRKVGSSNHARSHHVYLTNHEHPITRGLPDGTFFGSDALIDPVVYSEDPEAVTLGRLLPSHGMPNAVGEFPGFVVRQFADWTSVFIGAPNLPSAILRNLARFAGCHIYNDQDALIDANSHFVSIHTAGGGPKTIQLPRTTDVHDAFTGRVVARGARRFTVDLPAFGTGLYALGRRSAPR